MKRQETHDLKDNPALASIDRPVDMVQVFRHESDHPTIAKEVVTIGVFNTKAAKIAEDAGRKFIMNHCPKIELLTPFWKSKLNLVI